jgi:hypothetical protein
MGVDTIRPAVLQLSVGDSTNDAEKQDIGERLQSENQESMPKSEELVDHSQSEKQETTPRYKVLVDDNFNYQDEEERYELGTYATFEEASGACRKLVDDWLMSTYKPGMTAAHLYRLYVGFGEDPFIIGPPDTGTTVAFSAWDYARERTTAICGRRWSYFLRFVARWRARKDSNLRPPDS